MSQFLEEVKDGKDGRHGGLKSGLPKLDGFTHNLQKAVYQLYGASSKSGKTALINYRHVLYPYLSGVKDYKVIYFSFEISKIETMAKFTAFFMLYFHDIHIDNNYVLSRGDTVITDPHYDKVLEIYKEHIIPLFGEYNEDGTCISEGMIDFIEDKESPGGIFYYLQSYAEKNGTFIKTPYDITIDGKTDTKERVVGYKENNPDLFTTVITDHVGLLKREKGLSKKENIDRFSQHMVFFRNRCKFSSVVVSQFNRGLGSIKRLEFSGEELKPTLEDFKDSGSLAEDASIVFALFNPTTLPHLDKYDGYDLKKIGKSFRSLHIIASRNTMSDVSVALTIDGKTGNFTELPKSRDELQMSKLYESHAPDSLGQRDFRAFQRVAQELSNAETQNGVTENTATLSAARGGGEFDFN